MTKIDIYYEGSLRTRCRHGENGQELKTDAPKDNMGKGELFSPTDLLGAALGTCVLTLIGIMANKLKADVSGLRLTLEKEMAKTPSRRIGKLTIHVYCPRSFDPETIKKLEEAGTYCPVHQSLHPEVVQEFHFHWGQS